MKKIKVFFLIVLGLAVCIPLSSCYITSENPAALREDYEHLQEEYESLEELHEESIDEHYGKLENCYDMINYYELLCQKYGFLTHEQAYSNSYYYAEPGALIYHTDFYCKKANTSKLQITDIFLYSSLEECAECEASCSESYVIRLLEPTTKLYHHTYEPCAPHFTKDYKTISTPYIATTEQKAKEMKYAPCPICSED